MSRGGPEEVTPGQRTDAPGLVRGIREPVSAKGSAADAARAHLAAREGRYRIARPDRDLMPVRTTTAGGSETVRLRQQHRGVDVLGGEYVVRMERKGDERVVTGTSGKYFTGLKVATEPEVDAQAAVELAVRAVEERLAPPRPGDDPDDAGNPLTGTARGLVVLPRGAGVLTQHVTVRGVAPGTGLPVLSEVYIEAKSGYPVLQYSGIKSFTAPEPAPKAGNAPARSLTSVTQEGGTKGSGVRLDGKTVELQVDRDEARKEYVTRDRSRTGAGGDRNLVSTWDARGRMRTEVVGQWPVPGLKEFGSPTPAFGREATDLGVVDAHWAAGKVHDYYKKAHGRDSLDGRGGPVNSLAGLGLQSAYAEWDGTKVIYGGGNQDYRPYSSALDVVGYTLTHGVIENSASLVPAAQSGSLGEAIADYFGNAIQTDVYGLPMDSPDSGLMGETLCRAKGPRACAARDMNDGRTTSKSFLGVAFSNDNGGVHLNSTIFSGALWDIREDLDTTLADRIVYKALTEYMTPLDGFTEGRNAVVAAAKDLKVSGKELRAVERAFDAHGIVPGWELALGVDSDVLFGRLNADASVGVGGGWWVTSKSNDDGSEPYSVWAGRVDGTGEKRLISPNDGRYHSRPATDGRTVVWTASRGSRSPEVFSRPLAGGPVKKLFSTDAYRAGITSLRVEGKIVTFAFHPLRGGSRVVYLRMGETDPVFIEPSGSGRWAGTGAPSLRDGRIAFSHFRREGYDIEVLDVATGKRTVMRQLGKPLSVGSPAITGKYVYWRATEDPDYTLYAIRRANLDGTGTVDINPAAGKAALPASHLTASDEAVTVATWTRADPVQRLWQLSPDGAHLGRVTCNRGEQLGFASAGGRQVLWIDPTTGYNDLVTRTRPAGTCG
ncbi:M4 family metallopeptidase [Streptomyces hesseae]|uniref:M4 family metallopeptidase n=1 Tax=Streptomyces hesseae TaxID=3075519 RepID=A0ABU2SUK7_9ACTN|nr:M4 family metallopeptidase [Streptomyces sp. DSM 40473]MDT0452693.1 M4 family metallopeptidase [Streptomyces sp. DSM 40473]